MSELDEFNFTGLFVFDMANNHQGSVEHGLKVVDGVGAAARKYGVRGAMKFQFRQLDTFIHPSHREASDNKHIPRFQSTRMHRSDYQVLMDAAREVGLLTMCTPFDEESVDIIGEMGFDIIKIASCSAEDWPLVEKASESGLPLICSTGGVDLSGIDALNSHFTHRGVEFAIMHCVSIYPTPPELLQLNQIEALRHRYPGRPIGWSTHEDPNDTTPVMMAVAKGATLFERHVGIETDEIKLNAYSSTPEQVDRWIEAYKRAKAVCGDNERPSSPKIEQDAIRSLKRGVYAKESISSGEPIDRAQVYFAMPCLEGQIDSGMWRSGAIASSDIGVDSVLLRKNVSLPAAPAESVLKTAVHEVKALLNLANVPLNSEFSTEYSHHYGISKFRETGAVLISCINREYCKKILVQLPGQGHPEHFHELKDETFQVLFGQLQIQVDGKQSVLSPGQICLVQPGTWHSFWTETGVVFEEISTRDVSGDSYYRDKSINRMERSERKTIVDHWGRFQLPEVLGNVGAE
ncbi:MAG: N,N'-diacetyllegionaminic acid synthase [Alphaproteobacteria bacterium MarineAlpha4_Bin2]|mgnify:CR=1 FL=1|nr:MAG: N,N'-diacetyllegionaminic acid synthase [Alphaproteobacteria bacterium MarineAlpha4_Bin2]